MRKILCLIMTLLMIFCLASCSFLRDLPDTVTIEEKTYKKVPPSLQALGPMETVEGPMVFGVHYRGVSSAAEFACYAGYDNEAEPVVYFLEEEFEEACAYYSDEANYTYECIVGNPLEEENSTSYALDIDPDKFDALLAFVTDSDYRPFVPADKPGGLRYVSIPDRNNWDRHEIRIYKLSRDGAFCTLGNIFVVVDGKLTLLYYYDFADENDPQMAIVDLPDDLNDYFYPLVCDLKA